MYLIGSDHFDPTSATAQNTLAAAYKQKIRPRCQCSQPNPQMYIAYAGNQYILKRMPGGGQNHAPDCKSFLPAEEVSGLAQLTAGAINEDPDDGTTTLQLGFPLSVRAASRSPAEWNDSMATEVTTAPKKMTLTSLLHFLWSEAELTKWKPAFEKKRWWGLIRRTLISAATDKLAKGAPLSGRIFIPDAFKIDDKAQIAHRRQESFAKIFKSENTSVPLGLLVAEYKTHKATQRGGQFTFKQMPDCLFFAERDFVDRFDRIAADTLDLIEMVDGAHLMVIATFKMARQGYPVLRDLAMMPVTKEWLPFEIMRDVEVINTLVSQRRSFQKSM